MRYLITSCTLYDLAGVALIKGFINGISQFDSSAHVMSLHKVEHHKGGFINWFEEPFQNEEAVVWSDVIVNIAGLNTLQPNQYEFVALAQKHNKPLIWASQSFKSVDKALFTAPNTKIVARGKRSANLLRNGGVNVHAIAPDLSFLIEPIRFNSYEFYVLKRVFSTHFTKKFNKMYELADPKTDIQVTEKQPQGGFVWEPEIPNITKVDPQTPEELFGIVSQAEECHCARYQCAVAAILAGKKPIIYGTGQADYDSKYEDLMDLYGKSAKELRNQALISCQLAAEAANGG